MNAREQAEHQEKNAKQFRIEECECRDSKGNKMWSLWTVISRTLCTNLGTYSVIQERKCSQCGLTQIRKQSA